MENIDTSHLQEVELRIDLPLTVRIGAEPDGENTAFVLVLGCGQGKRLYRFSVSTEWGKVDTGQVFKTVCTSLEQELLGQLITAFRETSQKALLHALEKQGLIEEVNKEAINKHHEKGVRDSTNRLLTRRPGPKPDEDGFWANLRRCKKEVMERGDSPTLENIAERWDITARHLSDLCKYYSASDNRQHFKKALAQCEVELNRK